MLSSRDCATILIITLALIKNMHKNVSRLSNNEFQAEATCIRSRSNDLFNISKGEVSKDNKASLANIHSVPLPQTIINCKKALSSAEYITAQGYRRAGYGVLQQGRVSNYFPRRVRQGKPKASWTPKIVTGKRTE